jgi:anaphase-promoting complex subunit 4
LVSNGYVAVGLIDSQACTAINTITGKCLAVALNTGFVDIISGETGKIIRHGGDDPFSIDAANPKSKVDRGEITCLGWGTVLTRETVESKKPSKTALDQSMINDLWARLGLDPSEESLADDEDDVETQGQEALLKDLPRQLAFLDVESILPRLSPIPTRHTASGRYDMFATQAALDDYFDSMQRKDRLAADVMFVGHSGGRNRVTVDDILEIKYTPDFPGEGIERSMEEDETPHSLIPLMYASHPRSKHHAILRAERDDEASEGDDQGLKNLHISLFDIPLMSSGGSHLHLIISRTAQLRDLCGYISCSIVSAKSDWTTHTNLPSRFMENVNETLEEKGEGVLEDNLYHLAMTGNFTPTILEWLRDELAERGHKRWDHAMTTLYNELSKILHTNLLPVLERSTVVATNLRGLARYYLNTRHFNVPPDAFTSILSTLSSLQLLVHETIQILGTEQRQFRAFSRWLRHQIDLAAADPESLSAKDMAERETPQLDLPNTLAYLEGGLTKSRLKAIIFSTPSIDNSQHPTTNDLITCIHTSRNTTQDPEVESLLSLHLWSSHLNTVCKSAHHHISLWHQSRPPSTTDILCRTDATTSLLPHLDIRMLETSTSREFYTYVIGVPAKPTHQSNTEVFELGLWHQVYKPDGSEGSGWRQIILPSSTPTPSTISALKFLDDETFLCLFCHGEVDYLLCLPYRDPSSATDPQNHYRTMDELAQAGVIAHTFDDEQKWIPEYLVANGKKKRRNCVVVEKDRKKWKIFDLEGFRSGGVDGDGAGLMVGNDDEDEEVDEESMVFD